ncbi:hypothetical protein [Nitrospira sp. Kam-Ns4a]
MVGLQPGLRDPGPQRFERLDRRGKLVQGEVGLPVQPVHLGEQVQLEPLEPRLVEQHGLLGFIFQGDELADLGLRQPKRADLIEEEVETCRPLCCGGMARCVAAVRLVPHRLDTLPTLQLLEHRPLLGR